MKLLEFIKKEIATIKEHSDTRKARKMELEEKEADEFKEMWETLYWHRRQLLDMPCVLGNGCQCTSSCRQFSDMRILPNPLELGRLIPVPASCEIVGDRTEMLRMENGI